MTLGVSNKEHSFCDNFSSQESVFKTFTKSDLRFLGVSVWYSQAGADDKMTTLDGFRNSNNWKIIKKDESGIHTKIIWVPKQETNLRPFNSFSNAIPLSYWESYVEQDLYLVHIWQAYQGCHYAPTAGDICQWKSSNHCLDFWPAIGR